MCPFIERRHSVFLKSTCLYPSCIFVGYVFEKHTLVSQFVSQFVSQLVSRLQDLANVKTAALMVHKEKTALSFSGQNDRGVNLIYRPFLHCCIALKPFFQLRPFLLIILYLSQIAKCICLKLQNVFVSNCKVYLSRFANIFVPNC